MDHHDQLMKIDSGLSLLSCGRIGVPPTDSTKVQYMGNRGQRYVQASLQCAVCRTGKFLLASVADADTSKMQTKLCACNLAKWDVSFDTGKIE
jgi:hypothetical protein